MMIALSFLLSLSACLLWTGAEGQSSGDLRLVARNGQTTSSLTAGRLEVYYNRQWGTVCDDLFGIAEAHVACSQLGFVAGSLYDTNVGFTSSSFATRFTQASNSTPIWFDSLNCDLSDSRLIDCARSIGVHDCTHAEDVVLFCRGDGAVRLLTSVTGSSSASTSAGRVEVYFSGRWGTVCDDSFGQTEADVVCRQLGYPSASTYGRAGSLGYSQGIGRIWLTDVECSSSDLMLSTCTSSRFPNINSCSNFNDVAVICNTLNSNLSNAIASAVIAGIVIAVLVPLCCIGICVTIIVIAVCTGACAAGAASSRGRRRNVNVAAAVATIPPPVATATVVTGTGAAVNAPPPYTSAAYPTQPPKASAPGAYPQQPGYPPQAGGAGYPPYPVQAGGAPQQQPPAAYPPQQPPADEQKVELQQYPADPAYPPQPYPAAGYPPPTNQ